MMCEHCQQGLHELCDGALGRDQLPGDACTCGECNDKPDWPDNKNEILAAIGLEPKPEPSMIQDPCGDRAIILANEVLKLVTNRDDTMCSILTDEIRQLNKRYQRR